MNLAIRALAWRDPVSAFAPFADEPYAVLLLSAGLGGGRWSYMARRPSEMARVGPGDPDLDFARLRRMLGPRRAAVTAGPPFQGGVIGLIAYEFGDRLEPLGLPRDPDWPDLILARYDAFLAFDHQTREVIALGPSASWLDEPTPPSPDRGAPAESYLADAPAGAYESAVADVKERIGAGEIFQANIARGWSGALRPGTTPFDAFARLVGGSPAPYCAYWRLPGLALVSHSPERFLSLAEDRVETSPIKGTRPRGADSDEDRRLAVELLGSEKDRAENLMIVDLMRNDLSRVCQPGSVKTPRLFDLQSHPSVHHLVSTVTGRLRPGLDAADLLGATFPPGSITGAPKIQAMKVIAAREPPRGPWCGALFWAGVDGALESSVLIRTAAFTETDDGWRFRVTAGAGIVADSDPMSERLETEVKSSGLAHALTGAAP